MYSIHTFIALDDRTCLARCHRNSKLRKIRTEECCLPICLRKCLRNTLLDGTWLWMDLCSGAGPISHPHATNMQQNPCQLQKCASHSLQGFTPQMTSGTCHLQVRLRICGWKKKNSKLYWTLRFPTHIISGEDGWRILASFTAETALC